MYYELNRALGMKTKVDQLQTRSGYIGLSQCHEISNEEFSKNMTLI